MPVYFLSVITVLAVYIILLGRGCPHFYEVIYDSDSNSAYQKLSDSFLQGRVDVMDDPDPSFYNPEDPMRIYILRYRTFYISNHMMYDYSYFKNKHSPRPRYYLYFGPGVAILFYMPMMYFFHYYMGAGPVFLIMSALNVIFFAGIVRSIVAYWLDNVPLYVQSLTILMYGLCNLLPNYMDRPQHKELAIAGGVVFCVMAIYGLIMTLNAGPGIRLFWMWIAGTGVGLAMSCRCIDVMMSIPLILTWLYLIYTRKRGKSLIKTAIRCGLALFSSPFLIGLALLWYNYIRFDNPFETGIRYQLNSAQNIDSLFFAFKYVPDGIWAYFLLPYQIVPGFPYIDYWNYTPPLLEVWGKTADNHTGLLVSFPICILGFFWPYYVLKLTDASVRRGVILFASLVSIWLILLTAVLTSYFVTAMRYETELQMPMLILSTIIVFARRHALGPWVLWEKILLILISGYSSWMGFVYGLIGPWHWIESYLSSH